MLKLYNIFEDVILENKELITESITRGDIIEAIDSFYRYKIWYQGAKETNSSSLRYVDFYAYGKSSAGNDVVRVYQAGGYSTTGTFGHWKLLRVDRILRMIPTGQHVGYKPIHMYGQSGTPPFNEYGDKSMSQMYYIKRNFKKD